MSAKQDAEAISALSNIDLSILRLQKQLDELPQKQQIMEVRHKAKELEAKAQQVEKMAADVARILQLLSDETQLTESHIVETQAALNKSSDYRETTALAAEMEMLSGRKAKLEEDSLLQLEKQEKVSTVQAQVDETAQKLAHEEQIHTKAYMEIGGQLKQEIADLEHANATLVAQLPTAWQSKYKKAREGKQGIGAAHLAGNQCSGCHATLSEGQLAKLLEGPLVGECPNCSRLMVVA